MTWLRLLKALLIAVAALADVLGRRQWIEGADAQSVSQGLKKLIDDIVKADAARASVRRSAVRNPGRLRDDDGFRRRE